MSNVRQQWYAKLECDLTDLLPPHWRNPWEIARANKEAIVTPPRRHWFKPAKPLGLCKPSTAAILLSHALAYRAAGASLPTPVTDDAGLLDPECARAILDGPLAGYAGATRAMTLRGMASFAWRCLGRDALHLYIASKRILANEPRYDRSTWLRKHAEYWDVARGLDPQMEPGEEHRLDTAIWSRRASTAIIAVEIAPRKGELVGLEDDDVVTDGETVSVHIPASLSKTNVSQIRYLTAEGNRIVFDYSKRARPFLLSLGDPSAEPTAFWLTEKGRPLSAEGVIATLRQDMAKRLGTRVCCNFLRSASVSRPGIDQLTASDLIGQRSGSQVANDIYAVKNYREALADMGELWEAYD